MKMNCMKRVWNKMTFSLALLGVAGVASLGLSQEKGNICSIQSSYDSSILCTTPGEVIEFTIRLGDGYSTNNYMLAPQAAALISYGNTLQASFPLKLKMSTGGYATLVATQKTGSSLWQLGKTDFIFQYTVRAGDIGLPLTIAGSAGQTSSGVQFSWLNADLWKVGDVNNTAFNTAVNPSWNTAPQAIWRFGNGYDAGSDKWDFNLSAAGIKVQTLTFDSAMAVNVGDKVAFTLSSTEAVSNTISVYVWSGDTNYFTLYNGSGIGSGSNTVVGVSIPAGSAGSTAFSIYGVKATPGTIPLYISNHYGFDTTGSISNYYVTVPVTVNPTTPTIRVTPTDTGTYTEDDTAPHYLSVTLSEVAQATWLSR